MATNPESTDQGIPFKGNPSPFPSWGNIGAPYMATLSLPGLTIGLLLWLFSTSVVQNAAISPKSSMPPDEPEIYPLPSSLFVSPSPSSSLLGESSDTSNQVAEKKKKGKEKKKKPIQQGDNQATIALNASSNENMSIKLPKAKYLCIICAGDHFHRDCPYFPRILKEWSSHSHHPVSSTSGDYVGSTPSTSDSKVHGRKGKVRIPCRLCEGNHSLNLCPFLDEAERVLDNFLASP